jgi:Zn-dependent protease with chaperone function
LTQSAGATGTPEAFVAGAPDPWALPSDTDFRFALLVAVALGVTLYVYNVLFFAFSGGGMDTLGVYGRCDGVATAAARRAAAGEARGAGPDPLQVAALRLAAFERCIGPVRGATTAWMVGGGVAVALLAGALYWTYPARLLRRHRFSPLPPEDAPEVLRTLEGLRREAGLAAPPRFVWNPLRASASGLAFGRAGRYYVALSGGLVTQHYTDPPAFRAVVLHELAHLRNGDVDKTYFALATWQAFVALALVPYLLSLVGQPFTWAVAVTWRVLLLSALLFLTRNALLRTRELYADARAATWEGHSGALRRVLGALSPRSLAPGAGAAGEEGPAWRRRLRPLLRLHPPPEERRQALDDPRRLFRLGFWEACGAGIATTVAAPHVATLLRSAGLAGAGVASAAVGAALLFAPLAAGVLALRAWRVAQGAAQGTAPVREPGQGTGWRSVSPARRLDSPLPSPRPVGLGLGIGFLAGRLLSFEAVVAGDRLAGAAPGTGPATAWIDLTLALALLGGTLALLWWLGVSARAWLPAVGGSLSGLRLGFGASLAGAGLALALWLGVLVAAQEAGALLLPRALPAGAVGAAGLAVSGALRLLLAQPLAGVALMALVAIPVLGRLWRGFAPGGPD